jgi:hypothetical protein
MKKIIVAVLGLAMMSSSVAFAAAPISHSKLSAFQNVKTTSVSTDELSKVSGAISTVVKGLFGFSPTNLAHLCVVTRLFTN